MNALIIENIEYRLFNRNYAVSAAGVVIKTSTQTIVPLKLNTAGYLYIAARIMVHRMVATCWLERSNEKANDVHHINEIRTDNRAANLQWLTRQDHLDIHPDRARFERSPETKKKLSEALTGRKISEETKDKLRIYRTGRKTSDETKEKQRQAAFRLGCRPPARPKGFKVSAEQCSVLSKKHWRNTACEINGIRYRSFSDAGKILGIMKMTIRKRCLSPNFTNYMVVND